MAGGCWVVAEGCSLPGVSVVFLPLSDEGLVVVGKSGIALSRPAILLPNKPAVIIRAAITIRRTLERMKVGSLMLRIFRSGGGGGCRQDSS